MCFGSPKTPQVQAAPTPAPAPTVMPTEVSPQASGEARRKRLEQLRAGFATTLKTGPQGITGAGPDLKAPSLLGQKDKLGQ